MASFRAEIVRRLLRFTGLKKFFSSVDLFEEKLTAERVKGPDMPKAKFRRDFNIEETTRDGYRVFTISSKSKASSSHVLYLHGGGYVLDLAWAHWDFIGRLIKSTGVSVTLPIYPLAPETKCAALIPAMQSLFESLAKTHDDITVMGDSAGAGLTLTLAQVLRGAKSPSPTRLVLLSPWLDASGTDPSQPEIETRDVMLAINGLRLCAERYRGELAIDHPWVSPLFGELSDLPPILMFAGTDDILLPDARRLSAKLTKAGIAHSYEEYPEMYHVWMLVPIPEGKRALGTITEFMAA